MDQFDRQVLRATLDVMSGVAAKATDPASQAALSMGSFMIAHALARADGVGSPATVAAEIAHLQQDESAEKQILSAVALHKSQDQAMNAESLTTYLRRILGDPAVTVVNAQFLLGGFSKQTILLTLSGGERFGNKLVLRCDLEGGPVESQVADEYPVVKFAFESGVSVAEPLYVDRASPFGGTCMLTRMVSGKTAYDAAGVQIQSGTSSACTALARVLGKIHSLRVSTMALSSELAGASLGDHVRRMVGRYEDQWKRRRINPSPTMEVAFAWLYANVPEQREPTLVHGDASLRNLMVENGRETAILDWELWHIGDHNEDLAYCKDEVEKFMKWDDFMAEYTAHGGLPYDSEAADYYMICNALRNAVFADACMHAFVHAETPDPKFVYGAILLGRPIIPLIAERLSQKKTHA